MSPLKTVKRFYSRMKMFVWFHFVGSLTFFATFLGLAFEEWQPRSVADEMLASISPAFAVVRSAGTWKLSCVIQADSMAVGGGVKVRFIKGFSSLQYTDPNLRNYVSAGTSRPRTTIAITSLELTDAQVPWDWDRNGWVVTAQIHQNALYNGDTIQITFGANPPKGRLVAPPSAFIDTVLVAYDMTGNGIYRELRQRPALEIVSQSAYRLAGYLPSTTTVSAPVTLKIVVLDEYDNLATSFTGSIMLASTDLSAQFSQMVELSPSDSGRKNVTMVFNSPSVHYMQLGALGKGPDALWQVRSNPIEVLAETPRYQVFWGDLHSHSRNSHDGHGTNNFQKARDVACLDFYALTDHTSNDWKRNGGLTAQEWEAVKRDVIRYHQPGKFVTFPAYEFSAKAPSGHHNIFFNAPDELVPSIPLFRDDVYLQVQKVWELQETLVPPNVDMITIPHHTGIIFDTNLPNRPLVSFGKGFSNDRLRPLIEIFSIHGLSEYYAPDHPLSYKSIDKIEIRGCASGPHYAQDAWASGETLGVIAASDDHSARPGLPYNGLTAVYASELSRDAIFQALKNRQTYGTTGQRLLLHFDINGYLMGSQIILERGKYPEISVEVHGTDDLEFMEVLGWDIRQGRQENGHPLFETLRRTSAQGRHLMEAFVDSTYAGSSIYYVRVKQKRDIQVSSSGIFRQVWAWSSPIWVKESQALDTASTNTVPQQLELVQNYPNPFDRHTLISYYLSRGGKVEVILYNAVGQRLRWLLQDVRSAGWHTLQLPSSGLANGIYFIRLEAAGRAMTRKIVVMK
ncbi:DUF3604 domain-containing protein [candidate division KSB1 bacterium]|nr:DUF3604 domain-containing protein [candidate division KSB1 bacterium]